MTIEVFPAQVQKEAKKLMAVLEPHLPPNTKWALEEPVDEDIYLLVIYADLEDEWAVREVARKFRVREGDPDVLMALIFDPASRAHK